MATHPITSETIEALKNINAGRESAKYDLMLSSDDYSTLIELLVFIGLSENYRFSEWAWSMIRRIAETYDIELNY